MDANRFYSVPWDGYNDVGMKLLRKKHGGVAAYGRWHAMLGILYDRGGRIELDEDFMLLLEEELEMDRAALNSFIDDLAKLGWVNADFLDMGVLASAGVIEQLEYRKKKQRAGSIGAEARWQKKPSKKH